MVWQDGKAGWRWTTADGRFDSKPYPTKREAEDAERAASKGKERKSSLY